MPRSRQWQAAEEIRHLFKRRLHGMVNARTDGVDLYDGQEGDRWILVGGRRANHARSALGRLNDNGRKEQERQTTGGHMANLLWLADVARGAGLDVQEIDGWRTRGRTYCTMNPKGVVCHHTAGPATGDMPSLDLLIKGRKKLPGPLCHYGLGRSGKVYVVAAGTANHAGSGGWKGLDSNCDVIGIEAENTGRDPWPKAQLDAYVALVAAICEHLNIDTSMVAAHREWAPTRKPDPHSIRMDEFRRWVDQARTGAAFAVTPPIQKKPEFKFEVGRVTVSQQLNDAHPDVRRAQGLLTAYSPVGPGSLDGVAGPKFDWSVREFQALKGLTVDGEVGEVTWKALEGVD